jgi:hypothetical protein
VYGGVSKRIWKDFSLLTHTVLGGVLLLLDIQKLACMKIGVKRA